MRFSFFAGLLALSITGAACGGGGGSTAPAGAGPTATPSNGPLTSSSASTNVTVGSAPSELFLAPIVVPAGSVSSSASFGTVTSGSGTIGDTLSAANPNAVTPASMARRPAAIGALPVNPIAYLSLHFSAADVFASAPSIAFSVPSGATAPNGWWVASLDENNAAAGWNNPVHGALNGSVLTLPSSTFGFTVSAADTYDFVLFAPGGTYPTSAPTATASASPTPSVSATASATPTVSPSPSPSATPLAFTCNNAGFITDQTNFAAKTITADQPVDVCGTVAAVTAQTNTNGSGNTHGYWYITIPEGTSSYNIEIVSNLTAMAEASTDTPPTWPWVTVGQYAHVRGRYYYDNASSQGIDWTEDDTSNSWSQLGFVNICDAAVTTCVKYW